MKALRDWLADPRCVVKERLLRKRLSRGERLEDALTRPAQPAPMVGTKNGKRISAFGESKTVRQWIEDPRCVVHEATLCRRIERGMDPETALTKLVFGYRRRTQNRVVDEDRERRLLSAFGEQKTFNEWMDDPRRATRAVTVYRRVQKGWPLESAISTPSKDTNKREAFGERKTLRQWADDPRCTVSAEALRISVLRGIRLEVALNPTYQNSIPIAGGLGKTWNAFGESLTIREWAKDPRCVVKIGVLRDRLRLGMDPEVAITAEIFESDKDKVGRPVGRRKTSKIYYAFGIRKSLGEWYYDPRCVVSKSAVRGRLRLGWPFEKAIATPAKFTWNYEQGAAAESSTSIPSYVLARWTAFGRTMTSKEWSEDPRCVVPLESLRKRLRRGMDPEAAMTQPIKVTVQSVTAFGVTKSLREWVKDPRCCVSRHALSNRLKAGIPPKIAISEPQNVLRAKIGNKWKPRDTGSRLREAFGKHKTLADWYLDSRCIVNRSAVLSRLRRGWSLEKALTTPANSTGK